MTTVMDLPDCADTTDCAPLINSINTTLPTCSVATGQITINASGTGGTLEYSINSGATYQSSPTFTALPAGTYNVVVRYVKAAVALKHILTTLFYERPHNTR